MSQTKKSGKHQKLPEAVRRAAILEAAHKLFNQKGFAKTRMDDVAAMAGQGKFRLIAADAVDRRLCDHVRCVLSRVRPAR